ncbi:microsomal dipeptidase-like Zn-dependent dipeptidase [Sphingorhabdus rigui]|uniref:Microsomal dipeptidase-like Zn-dependent dipeptidase n=1 Tax=Sphingorhabdus rigui TaxID=1282858 RepID=A0A840AY00_9SPHN|nr:dipeptidase [Sphingorhabdus rigui]MBB3941826.1 microsomal dipeptidase-like Zn-dependent dipeptidase [Sphingorhabdus rigui]
MRKKFWIPLTLIGAAAIGFFGFLPGYVEGSMNQIDGQPLIKVSDEAKALHKTLNIVDLHSDTLMWNRDLGKRADRGHMDLPRLQEGNVALQLFSSVTKTPKGQNYDGNGADTDNITLLTFAQLQPVKTWRSLVERSLYHASKRDSAVTGSDGKLQAVNKPQELDALLAARQKDRSTVGAMLTIEGLHNLEGKAENLDRLYDAGFRMAGFTHFFDNELGGSMHGLKKRGLTPFGRDILRRMEAKGMIVDIAHLSHAGVAEVLAMAKRPVVSSHGGVQATCKVNRNLTDDEVRGVAKTGGIIGIGYWEGAICSTDPRAAAKAMKHVRDLVGIQHVALGSDYDGATTVRFDTSQLAQVTQALMDEGFTPDEIRAVMGENALRVIRAGLVPMANVAK